MKKKKKSRRVWSLKHELLTKSREAALGAIRIFNDPQVMFKTESFIVLMNIAWTYLLHAYYREQGIEYRYYKQRKTRRLFDRTKHGAHKYWELERCLNDEKCPIDKNAATNLRFLIGLRHEIEHQMTLNLDNYLSGRYQACALNFNEHIKRLFGPDLGIDSQITYSIQFLQMLPEQFSGLSLEDNVPPRLREYISAFDGALSHDEYNSPQYSFRLVFKQKLVNHPGQSDRVIDFIKPDSDLAKSIDKEYWVQKHVEKPKFRPTDVCKHVHEAGFKRFRPNPEHSRMWKTEDAKNPAKNFGVEVQGVWYWYENWVERCMELCQLAGETYKAEETA
jgi:hypothetical protein